MNLEEIQEQIFHRLNKFKHGKLLDLCSGRGDFLKIIEKNIPSFSEIYAVDFIEIDKSFFDEKIKFQKMSAEKLKFSNEYFDVITLSNSLHHLENINSVFLEIKRVLKKDGLLIINEMFSDNQTSAQKTHVMFHHFSAEINKFENIYHRETYLKNEIIEIVKNNNFNISSFYEYNIKSNISVFDLETFIKKLLDKVPEEKKEYFEKKFKYIIENHLFYGFDNATELILFCSI